MEAIILFTDSIPLISMIFKIFSPILPETFQFIGIYILVCFILQGVSSAMIAKLFTKNKIIILISTMLFVFSPIMIERAFRHSALTSHWLLTFSIYLLLKSKIEGYAKCKWQFILLNVLATGITPYFMGMIMGIILIIVLGAFLRKRKMIKYIIFFFMNIFSILTFGFITGAIGGSNGLDGWGFGVFSMNLNSIINPSSLGIETWSLFLKNRPQILGNYDGFNYLGAGIILALIGICIRELVIKYDKNLFERFNNFFRRNIEIIIGCCAFTIYSLSNVVTLNDKILFSYNLPKIILKFCGIFRASGRFFWPVYYMIFIYVLFYVVRKFSTRKACMLLITILIFQIADLSPAIKEKNNYFNSGVILNKSECFSEPWQYIGNNYSKLNELSSSTTYGRDYELAAFAGKYNMINNIVITNRGMLSGINEQRERDISNITNGKLDKDTVYVTDDIAVLKKINENLKDNTIVCDLGNFKAILLKRNDVEFENFLQQVKQFNKVCNLNDDNWESGISRSNNILLFNYTKLREDELKRSKKIQTGSYECNIKSINIIDYQWIHIEIDGDKEQFKYPNVIKFVE